MKLNPFLLCAFAAASLMTLASNPQALGQAYGDTSSQPSQSQLDQLTGPIALYPDPLVALILPASVVPTDIAAADSYLSSGGDPNAVDNQAWDPSVKALAHYPQVVGWMAQNMDWIQQLGSAYLAQPADVMNSIQRLRAQARAVGSLRDTPQQRVIVDGSMIEIVPAQSDQIYIPTYDPGVVYVAGGDPDEEVEFGPAYSAGVWLTFGFDWTDHRVWVGNWQDWHQGDRWGHPDWGRGGYAARDSRGGEGHAWQAPTNRPLVRASVSGGAWSSAVARPRPMASGNARGQTMKNSGAAGEVRSVPQDQRGSTSSQHNLTPAESPSWNHSAQPAANQTRTGNAPTTAAPESSSYRAHVGGSEAPETSVSGETRGKVEREPAPVREAPSVSNRSAPASEHETAPVGTRAITPSSQTYKPEAKPETERKAPAAEKKPESTVHEPGKDSDKDPNH